MCRQRRSAVSSEISAAFSAVVSFLEADLQRAGLVRELYSSSRLTLCSLYTYFIAVCQCVCYVRIVFRVFALYALRDARMHAVRLSNVPATTLAGARC